MIYELKEIYKIYSVVHTFVDDELITPWYKAREFESWD